MATVTPCAKGGEHPRAGRRSRILVCTLAVLLPLLDASTPASGAGFLLKHLLKEVLASRATGGAASGSYRAEELENRANPDLDPADLNEALGKAQVEFLFSRYLVRERIDLSGGAYLQLEDDGRLVFYEAGFEGYLTAHHNGKLTVSGSENEILLTIQERDGSLVIRQRKSVAAARVMDLLTTEE